MQLHGHRYAADVVDHRLVYGEAGVGVQDLIAGVHQREHGEKHDRLAARGDHHVVGLDLDVAGLGDLFGDTCPYVRQTRRRTVVGEPVSQGFDASLDDVGRSVEVRFSDLQVDDVLALRL